MQQKRRGPKPSYLIYGGKVCSVKTEHGETGILYDQSANTYYYLLNDDTGKRRKHNLGRDKDKAVIRFYQEVSEQKSEPTVSLPLTRNLDTGTIQARIKIADRVYWEQVKKDLLERPEFVAQKTGIEALIKLPELLYTKAITLEYLFQEYLKKTIKPLDKKHIHDAKSMWYQFIEAAGLSKTSAVEQVNRKSVNRYHDFLLAEKAKQKWSVTWVNHRIVLLKCVFKYNKRRIDNNQNISKALDIVNDVLTQQKQNGYSPSPISLEDFWALYEAANDYWKLILLLALNTGSYFIDLYLMQWENFCLEKGTLSMIRRKTNLPKCAVLFPEVLKMLRDLRAKRKDTIPYVFLSNNKSRYGVLSMQSYFSRVLRKNSKINKLVKWNNIRDAVKTSAEIMKARTEEVSLILGWKLPGVADHYLKRNPAMTKDACDKVYEYFQVAEHTKGAK